MTNRIKRKEKRSSAVRNLKEQNAKKRWKRNRDEWEFFFSFSRLSLIVVGRSHVKGGDVVLCFSLDRSLAWLAGGRHKRARESQLARGNKGRLLG